MSRFLVIGSNSFSGASFSNYLLQNNHEVMGVSRSEQINDVFLPYQWDLQVKEGFQSHQVDLNNDLSNLIQLIIDYQPQYIVNFAAQGMVAQSWDTPEDWYQTNVVAQVKLHNEL